MSPRSNVPLASRGHTKAPSPRRRRSPEQARSEILEAAERLLVERGPDAVGLQAVAREVGVSHALVTHYFGTYEALVGEVLAQSNARFAERLRRELLDASPMLGTIELLDRFFAALSDPALARLRAWALLTGRQAALPQRGHVLTQVLDALTAHAARVAKETQRPAPPRKRIETALLVGLAASQWWGLAREQQPQPVTERAGLSAEEDATFRDALGAMLAYWVGV